MLFRNHPAERLAIESIASRLTDEENAFRMALMERTIESGGPVAPRTLTGAGIGAPDVESLIERLIEKRAVAPDREGHLNFIYPVSALPTRHRVSLMDGRRFFAMCAIDAMGSAFTFEQDVEIESECSECGGQISVRIERGELTEVTPSNLRVLHADLKRFDNWAAAV